MTGVQTCALPIYEEMAVENEVMGAEVGEDGEAEKRADVEME